MKTNYESYIRSNKHEDGQDYEVVELYTAVGKRQFRTRLLEPEAPVTNDLTVLAYGLGANSFVHEDEADAIAKLGYPIAIHDEPRIQRFPNLGKLITDPDTREYFAWHTKNPLIFASQALSQVIAAAREHDDKYQKIKVKGHSKGAVTAAMLAAYDPTVRDVILDGPGGIVSKNAAQNHIHHGKSLFTDEVSPLAKQIFHDPRAGLRERAIRNLTDEPLRFGREILMFVATTPRIEHLLIEIHGQSEEARVAVIGHEHDRFFERNDVDADVQLLLDRGLVDVYERVDGTKHINPNINPKFSAELFDKVVKALEATRDY